MTSNNLKIKFTNVDLPLPEYPTSPTFWPGSITTYLCSNNDSASLYWKRTLSKIISPLVTVKFLACGLSLISMDDWIIARPWTILPIFSQKSRISFAMFQKFSTIYRFNVMTNTKSPGVITLFINPCNNHQKHSAWNSKNEPPWNACNFKKNQSRAWSFSTDTLSERLK